MEFKSTSDLNNSSLQNPMALWWKKLDVGWVHGIGVDAEAKC